MTSTGIERVVTHLVGVDAEDVTDFMAAHPDLFQRPDGGATGFTAAPSDVWQRSDAVNGLVRMSDVRPERVDWVWPGRLARGKLTLFDGDPGVGKSALTVDLAARVTTGAAWPDGVDGVAGGSGVVILSAEDGLGDTIRPRLDAAGADCTRAVAIIDTADSAVTIPDDLDRIYEAVQLCGATLVIVDPLMAFLGSDTNAHSDQDVRRALRPFAVLADEIGVAVLVVRHLNKSGGGPPIYRGGGSIGIAAAARAVFLVGTHPSDPERCVLASVKSNLAAKPPALAYRLAEAANGSVAVRWDAQPVDVDAADLLATVTTESDSAGAAAQALRWLAETLRDGPVPSTELLRRAKDVAISEKTLRRAKTMLGVVAMKTGMLGGWDWSLPEGGQGPLKVPTSDARPSSAGPGHLRQPGDDRPERAGKVDHPPVDALITTQIQTPGAERIARHYSGDVVAWVAPAGVPNGTPNPTGAPSQ